MNIRLKKRNKDRKFRGILLVACLLLCSVRVAVAQDPDYARQIIDTLASPEMAGRGYTDFGHLKASEFIANEMSRLLVEPLNGTSYFQSFTVDVNTFPDTLDVQVNGIQLHAGYDYLPDPCSPSFDGTGKAVILNKGKLKSEKKLDSFLKKSKNQGKILVIPASLTADPNLSEALGEVEGRFKNDASVSFSALIIVQNEKLTWHMANRQCLRPVIRIFHDSLPVQALKEISLRVHARLLQNIETRNVCGMIRGSEYPHRYLLYSAHYDHLGQLGNEAYIPGANDDASGVALLLDLARYFTQNPPKISVVFIAFGAEELGLLGSRYFTEHPLVELDSICFMINLDIVGTGDEGIAVVNGKVFPDALALLKKLNDEGNYFPKIKVRGKAANSDHYYFTEKGVPSFFIYTMGGISAYHDVFDRPETLPLTRYNELFQLLIRFSQAICGL